MYKCLIINNTNYHKGFSTIDKANSVDTYMLCNVLKATMKSALRWFLF